MEGHAKAKVKGTARQMGTDVEARELLPLGFVFHGGEIDLQAQHSLLCSKCGGSLGIIKGSKREGGTSEITGLGLGLAG